MGYALGTLHPPHTAAVDGGKPIEDEKEREFGCKVHAKYGMYISIFTCYTRVIIDRVHIAVRYENVNSDISSVVVSSSPSPFVVVTNVSSRCVSSRSRISSTDSDDRHCLSVCLSHQCQTSKHLSKPIISMETTLQNFCVTTRTQTVHRPALFHSCRLRAPGLTRTRVCGRVPPLQASSQMAS